MMKIVSILLQVIGVSAGVLLGLWLKSGSAGADAPADETYIEADATGDEGHSAAEASAKDGDHGGKKKKDNKKKKEKKGKKEKSDHGKKKSEHGSSDEPSGSDSEYGFMKFSRQFIVPVIRTDNVNALVVIDINLEIAPESTENAYSREPKIRDALLSALLRLSNEGAFEDNLLEEDNIDWIRAQLLTAAQSILGEDATDVLILSIARQDF
jgi:flagellar protein FliL